MTIYQVVYYNQYDEKVADFGFYEDKLDAEKRALEIRVKTSDASGKVRIEDVFVYDSTDDTQVKKKDETSIEDKKSMVYDFK